MDNSMICKLEAEIEEYEKQIKKLEVVIEYLHRDMDSLRMRCKPGIEKYFDRKSYEMVAIVGCNEEVIDANALRTENELLKQCIAELESKESVKPMRIEFHADNGEMLTPLEVANSLINQNAFKVDELRELAEHLQVYCRHHNDKKEDVISF